MQRLQNAQKKVEVWQCYEKDELFDESFYRKSYTFSLSLQNCFTVWHLSNRK